jgi:hypothetical protein
LLDVESSIKMGAVLEEECGFTCPSAVVRKNRLILQNIRQQVFLIQVHPLCFDFVLHSVDET